MSNADALARPNACASQTGDLPASWLPRLGDKGWGQGAWIPHLTYFTTGHLKNDGDNYKYIWDAFGRLKEVTTIGSNATVAEYTYNGLGFRITEHHDTDTDGDVDGNDATYHFVYDERWRIVSTYRNDDSDPKEMFVHHCAGAGGYGSSSYIDAVILRDVDLSTAWNAQADALDARHYYCQNWHADVSVIIDDSAVLIERVMYSPYGVPFGIPVGDLVTATVETQPSDGLVGAADWNQLTTTFWGSSNNIADLDNDGDVDAADETILLNNVGASMGWGVLSDVHNRLGYAGYVFDEALAGTKWHVRHPVLESVLGRWIERRSERIGSASSTTVSQYQFAMSNATSSQAMSAQSPRIIVELNNKSSTFCKDATCVWQFSIKDFPKGEDANDYRLIQKVVTSVFCTNNCNGDSMSDASGVTYWEVIPCHHLNGTTLECELDHGSLEEVPRRVGQFRSEGDLKLYKASNLPQQGDGAPAPDSWPAFQTFYTSDGDCDGFKMKSRDFKASGDVDWWQNRVDYPWIAEKKKARKITVSWQCGCCENDYFRPKCRPD